MAEPIDAGVDAEPVDVGSDCSAMAKGSLATSVDRLASVPGRFHRCPGMGWPASDSEAETATATAHSTSD